MSFAALRLRRFRGFDEAEIRLKPLVVLLGPNSAGKSCFGNALVALKQAHERAASDPDLRSPDTVEQSRWPIDLGQYEDLAHQGSGGEVEISFQSPEGWLDVCFGKLGSSDAPFPGVRIKRLRIPGSQGDTRTTVAASPSEGVQIPVPQEMASENTAISPATPLFTRQLVRNDPEAWTADCDFQAGAKPHRTMVRLFFRGVDLEAVVDISSQTLVGFPKQPLKKLADLLAHTKYLGPSRASPKRSYALISRSLEGVGPNARWTAGFLWQSKERKVPSFLFDTSAASVGSGGHGRLGSMAPSQEPIPLLEAVSRWANHLGLASRVLCQRREHELTLEASVKDGLPPRPLNDIGFGLSQVLPVLVAGLSMEYGERLVVEQPEAHLHPRSQARLADFFCAMAKSDRHALVETHSEAFFHRLRYWQARDDELASRIVVYFLGEPSNQGLCGPPREIALSEEGEPSWPRGFLEDAFNAELEIRKLQAEKRERK